MHHAAVRWIADLLHHEERGLLAVIADGVPSMPEGLTLPLLHIADETRDDWVAYGTYPDEIKKTGACLIVKRFGTSEGDTLPNGVAVDTCQVGLHIVVPKTVDGVPAALAGMQAAMYLRAAKRVIARGQPEEVSTKNPIVFGCEIVPPRDSAFSAMPMYDPETLGGGIVLDALLVTVSIDDPWSHGYAPDVAPTA